MKIFFTYFFLILLIGCGTKKSETLPNQEISLPSTPGNEIKILTIKSSTYPWDDDYTQFILQGLENAPRLDELLKFQIKESDLVKLNCPEINNATFEEKKLFWVLVLAAIADPESGYNPNDAYREANGTVSAGLLQIDFEAANAHAGKLYDYYFTYQDMFDPKLNLIAGLYVMRNQLNIKGTIFTNENYYWSVLTHKQLRVSETFKKNSWQIEACKK